MRILSKALFLLVLVATITAQGAERKLTKHTDKHPNGKLKQQYSTYTDDKGKEIRHGVFTAWFENGQKRVEVKFLDGEPTGALLAWYASGKRRAEVNASDGEGTETTWYESGQKKEHTWNKGDDFRSEQWYESGQRMALAEAKGGVGAIQQWHENGTKMHEATVKGGKLDGPSASWYANGKMKEKGVFKNDVPVGLTESWDSQGSVLGRGTYKDGEQWKGSFVLWSNVDPKRAVIDTYKNGETNETRDRWYAYTEYSPKADKAKVAKGQVSDDATYGYTKDNPVKLGDPKLKLLGAKDASYSFLRHLRTDSLVPFDFRRVAYHAGGRRMKPGVIAVSDAKVEAEERPVIIDEYELRSRDGKEMHTIYIDMYHHDIPALTAKAPMGLVILKPPPGGPEKSAFEKALEKATKDDSE